MIQETTSTEHHKLQDIVLQLRQAVADAKDVSSKIYSKADIKSSGLSKTSTSIEITASVLESKTAGSFEETQFSTAYTDALANYPSNSAQGDEPIVENPDFARNHEQSPFGENISTNVNGDAKSKDISSHGIKHRKCVDLKKAKVSPSQVAKAAKATSDEEVPCSPPTINPKSQAMAAQMDRSGPVHDRLLQFELARQKKIEELATILSRREQEQVTGAPQVDKHSEAILRRRTQAGELPQNPITRLADYEVKKREERRRRQEEERQARLRESTATVSFLSPASRRIAERAQERRQGAETAAAAAAAAAAAGSDGCLDASAASCGPAAACVSESTPPASAQPRHPSRHGPEHYSASPFDIFAHTGAPPAAAAVLGSASGPILRLGLAARTTAGGAASGPAAPDPVTQAAVAAASRSPEQPAGPRPSESVRATAPSPEPPAPPPRAGGRGRSEQVSPPPPASQSRPRAVGDSDCRSAAAPSSRVGPAAVGARPPAGAGRGPAQPGGDGGWTAEPEPAEDSWRPTRTPPVRPGKSVHFDLGSSDEARGRRARRRTPERRAEPRAAAEHGRWQAAAGGEAGAGAELGEGEQEAEQLMLLVREHERLMLDNARCGDRRG